MTADDGVMDGDVRYGGRPASLVNGEIVARSAVEQLQRSYADVVSRRAWSELIQLFLPKARIEIDMVSTPPFEIRGATALARFIEESISGLEFFEFAILNTVVRLKPDGTARGRIYMVELRQERATGNWTNAFGVYHDDYAERDGRWRFATRHYQSLARKPEGQPAAVFAFPHRHSV